MKIQNLELQNFRNHQKTFMVFGDVNFVIGKNNSGKSTIKGGLELAVTGENEWAVGGRAAKDLVRYGEKEAVVEVEIDMLGTIKRVIRDKGNFVELNSSKIPDKEIEKEMLDLYGLAYEPLSCVINGSKFLNMKPNDQKNFLLRLTNASFDPNRIIGFMDNPSDEAKDTVSESINGTITIEALDALYNQFFANRRVLKKDLDTAKVKLNALGVVPAASGIDIASVGEQLIELKTKRESVLKKVAVIDEQSNQMTRLTSYLQKVQDKIAELEAKVDKSIVLADAEETIFGYVTEINGCEKDMEKFKATYNVLTGQNKSLNEMLSKLNTTKCPLTDKIVCNTDKSFLTNDLQAQIAKNDAEISEAKKQYDALSVTANDLKAKKEKLEAQLKLAGELDQQKEQKVTLEKDLAAIKVGDKTKLVAEMNGYEQDIKSLNDSMLKHTDWEKKFASFTKQQKDVSDCEMQVALYEYLVKEFSPKGVKARILQQIITPIEIFCNQRLAKLTNNAYRLQFSFDDNFDILVENKNGLVNLNSLSNSEKLRIGIIMQDAINNLTNAKVLFIDDAEILDGENTKLLIELLGEIKDDYESIFVIATNEDKNVASSLKTIQGSKVFFVEEGAVIEL